LRQYIEDNFDQIPDQELAQYPILRDQVPAARLKQLLHPLKAKLPELFRLMEPDLLPRVSGAIARALNQSVGVLCLSEVRDSVLMWGHYTEDHRGCVVGFDPTHAFFSKRRSAQDEFGFLRQVVYRRDRPKVNLTDTLSPVWFQTKCAEWAYEKEWRIVRVLSEAESRIEGSRYPICLFDFPPDSVVEIIIGLRSPAYVNKLIESLVPRFPRAAILHARENPTEYALEIGLGEG